MTTKKVITLSSVKQLIDLNGTSTNFDITFTAKSLDNSDFYALVVDQKILDSNAPLEFRLAKGSISANIISDNNVYQNHFLCLKSDKKCQIEVVIEKKEIPYVNRNIQNPISNPKQFDEYVINQPMEHFVQNNQISQNNQNNQISQNNQNSQNNQISQISQNNQINKNNKNNQINKSKSTNWFLIFVVCALAAGGLAYYYYFVYIKKKEKMTISHVVHSPHIVPAPQVPITTIPPEIETSNSFSARLSKLLEQEPA